MANAPKRAVTIQDVAQAAEVSTKTVSRVINNEAGVNAETRARVARIVKELDYRPNLNAQSLAGDRSFLLGLFIENPGSYVTDFQTGVIERCREAGYHLMVEPWKPGDPDLATKVLNLLRQLRLDGVILLPPHCDDPAILGALDREGVPIVRIAPIENRADSPVIRAHDYVASRLMTAHLLNLGHRQPPAGLHRRDDPAGRRGEPRPDLSRRFHLRPRRDQRQGDAGPAQPADRDLRQQ